MDFSQVEAEFNKLKAQFEAGALTEDEFKAQLEELMIQDEAGRWWMIGYETGQWYFHDGEQWVRDEPPPVAGRRREEPEAQADRVREPELRPMIATPLMDTLRRVPLWTYGRVAVLALILLGFTGPWSCAGASPITGMDVYRISLSLIFGGGLQGVVIGLTAIAVTVLFFVTLLRLMWRRLRENRMAIWLERIASGAALIGIGYGWFSFRLSLWGFWSALAGLLLAPLNLIAEHVINDFRPPAGLTHSSTDPKD